MAPVTQPRAMVILQALQAANSLSAATATATQLQERLVMLALLATVVRYATLLHASASESRSANAKIKLVKAACAQRLAVWPSIALQAAVWSTPRSAEMVRSRRPSPRHLEHRALPQLTELVQLVMVTTLVSIDELERVQRLHGEVGQPTELESPGERTSWCPQRRQRGLAPVPDLYSHYGKIMATLSTSTQELGTFLPRTALTAAVPTITLERKSTLTHVPR